MLRLLKRQLKELIRIVEIVYAIDHLGFDRDLVFCDKASLAMRRRPKSDDVFTPQVQKSRPRRIQSLNLQSHPIILFSTASMNMGIRAYQARRLLCYGLFG
jgi:hypothetical protein